MTRLGSTVAVALLLSFPVLASDAVPQNDPDPEIEKLRDDLKRPGADGRKAREKAVEQLLAMPKPEAHRVLSQALARGEDPDALRMMILGALERHLLQIDSQQFGGAPTEERRTIFTYYLGTLSEWWRKDGKPVAEPLRLAARKALMEMPVRELETAAGLLLDTDKSVNAPALFDCVADLQNLYLGQVLAEHVENKDPAVRAAARAALRLLTFRDRDFETKAEFVTWFDQNADMTYTNLAEQAAREGTQRMAAVLRQRDRALLDGSRRVVRAYADATPIDWDKIGKETLVDNPALVDACLQTLREALADRVLEGSSVPRQQFCRALLDRFAATPVAQTERRSLLLEVAAYTALPAESELAPEIQTGLLAGLSGTTAAEQLSALRGLRRYPSAENRAVIVAYAKTAVAQGAAALELIETAVATLAARSWVAPSATDADKAEWIDLVRSICERADLAKVVRDRALTLAWIEDSSGQRVPDVFQLLLDFALDTKQDSQFRSTCVIKLQGWDFPAGAQQRVDAMLGLLSDPELELRQQAAQALGKLVKSKDKRRKEWLVATIAELRKRLAVEEKGSVLSALVACMKELGSEPEMPGNAIGAINVVLSKIKNEDGTVPPEHRFRIDGLLETLVLIASSENAGNGQWLGACEQLLFFGRRPSLRLLLDRRHAAVNMAQDVKSSDPAVANKARRAMQVLIRTALLKPADRPWSGLGDEANAVYLAFNALEGVQEEGVMLDEPVHRLLRLEVALAGAHYAEVVNRTTQWLAGGEPNPAPGGAAPLTPEQRDHMRLLAADAQIGLTKPDLAAKELAQLDQARPLGARGLAVYDKVGKALVDSDAVAAVALFDRARKATAVEDPLFRRRLIDWATTSVKADATTRAMVWAEVQKHAAIFDAQDCPNDLREAFQGLRTER